MKRFTVNDKDRAEWIDNDEGLYSWWKSTKLPKRDFIKGNRHEIDEVVKNVVQGTLPAHYLKYGKGEKR